MPQLALNLDTLGELDQGAARLIIERELAIAVADADDRGEDKKPRKVTIEIELTRRADGNYETHVSAQAKLPPRKTAGTVSMIGRAGNRTAIMFQQWDPTNPRQTTMDFDDDDKPKKGGK